MGVAAASTSGRSARHVRASYAAMADSALRYASGAAASAAFSMDERVAAGDEHYGKAPGLGSTPPSQPPQAGAASALPKLRHKAVDDFSL
jgi:hypothetical protein